MAKELMAGLQPHILLAFIVAMRSSFALRCARRTCVTMASRTERPTFKRGRAKAVYDGIGLAAPSISGASAASGLPNLERPYCVLGIETSCDDTAAAVVRSDGAILGEAVVSQHEIHAQFGGIVPGLARDAHAEAIDEVVALAVERAGLDGGQQRKRRVSRAKLRGASRGCEQGGWWRGTRPSGVACDCGA